MKITLIAAMDGMGGIGKNGTLPWNIPEDLKHFKAYTDGKVCVMGRKTWDSLPVKPLPGRENWILCGNYNYNESVKPYLLHPNVSVPYSIQDVFDLVRYIDIREEKKIDELCIIGGASIYEQFLSRATHMVLTHIDGEHGCDTFFPKFNKDEWTLTGGKQLTTDALVRYWERK